MAEVIPLVENFEEDYALEIEAINELVDLIGVVNVTDTGIEPSDEEDDDE